MIKASYIKKYIKGKKILGSTTHYLEERRSPRRRNSDAVKERKNAKIMLYCQNRSPTSLYVCPHDTTHPKEGEIPQQHCFYQNDESRKLVEMPMEGNNKFLLFLNAESKLTKNRPGEKMTQGQCLKNLPSQTFCHFPKCLKGFIGVPRWWDF